MGFLSVLKGIGKAVAPLIPGVGPAISAGIGLGEAALQRKGAVKASEEQQRSIDQGIGEIEGGRSRAITAGRGALANIERRARPYIDPGTQAIGQLGELTGPGGELDTYTPETLDPAMFGGAAPTFRFDPSKITLDPAFERRAQRGSEAILAARAALGGLGSGKTGMALAEYNQDLVSDEYAKAYGRQYGEQTDRFASELGQYRDIKDTFMGNRDTATAAFLANQAATERAQGTRYGRLKELADLGYGATRDVGATETGFAGAEQGIETGAARDIAGLRTDKGDVRAAGIAGRTNALTSGLETTRDVVDMASQNKPLSIQDILKKYGYGKYSKESFSY